MIERPGRPRITPVPSEERTGAIRELLDASASVMRDANIFTTFVRAPGLFRRWIPFGGRLLAGKLPARDREILILRTAWNCRSPYEWGQHVLIARAAGLDDEEIARIPAGAGPGWTAHESALLNAADELHEDACISDGTWSALAGAYGTEQLIELPMLVGHYHLVAMALNSVGVELDRGLPAMPAPT